MNTYFSPVSLYKRFGLPCRGIFATLLLCLSVCGNVKASERPERWAEELASHPHRLAGTVESTEALDVIEQGLLESGIDKVYRQPFSTLQTEILDCHMEVDDGKRLELLPLRPNAILAPVTGAEGIVGTLTQGLPGSGEYGTGEKIVVLGQDAHEWHKAFAMGASAVVFTRESSFTLQNYPHINLPVNLPRYYFPGSVDELPIGSEVRLVSRIVWDEVEARNSFAFVEGTTRPDEVIVVSVSVDSFGIIPRQSPGAWNAINTVALMEMAGRFKVNPAERSILFAFFDADARGLSGTNAFYDLIAGDNPVRRFEDRRESVELEQGFVRAMLATMESGDLETARSDLRRAVLSRIKIVAMEKQNGLQDLLADVRLNPEKYNYDKEGLEELDRKRMSWTDFLKLLDTLQLDLLNKDLLDKVMGEVRRDLEIREQELERQESQFTASLELQQKLDGKNFLLHISLAFGDTTPVWGFIFNGESAWHNITDLPGLYGRVRGAFLEAYNGLEDSESVRNFSLDTVNGMISATQSLWGPQNLVHSGEAAGQYGFNNCVAGAVGLSLQRLGTRDDVIERYDIGRMLDQAREFSILLHSVASNDSLNLRQTIYPDVRAIEPGFNSNLRATGPQVWERNIGRMISSRPTAGAVIQVTPEGLDEEPDIDRWPYWGLLNAPFYDDQRLSISNRNGTYRLIGIPKKDEEVFGLAGVFDEDGSLKLISNTSSASDVAIRTDLVEAHSGWTLSQLGMKEADVELMSGRANARLEGKRANFGGRGEWNYWHVEPQAVPVKVFGKSKSVRLEAAMEQAGGFKPGFNSRDSANDIWNLNESRLNVLEDGGIIQKNLESLHERSRQWISSATDAKGDAVSALYTMGFWTEGAVYDRIRSTLNDIVLAVLFLLLLTIPFAVAMERLVIGAVMIQRRIAGFGAFFMIAFLGFFFTHPAFDLSSAPLIIFLGFGILLLSSVVITVLVRRFESELEKMQGMAGTAHSDQVSRLGTMAAAMQMGVSTMRRRPMRTAMSILTVSLLTFAILMFASFGSSLGIVKKFVRPLPSWSGVSVMQTDRSEIPVSVEETVRSVWPEKTISGRWWLVQEKLGGMTWPLLSEDGRNLGVLYGILGMEESELTTRDDMRSVLANPNVPYAESVFLSESLAERVGTDVGDNVLVNGIRLTVAQVIPRSVLAGLLDLTGEGFLPADFSTLEEKTETAGKTSSEPPRPMDILPADVVAIVPAAKAKEMGANLRILNIYTDNTDEAKEISESLAYALETPVIATLGDGVYWNTLGVVVQASGFGQLIVPILLGALVIFGTLLGSVVDREREIYTFSALGLAPAHVASLFLAESMIYAIVGGVAGFLGTQLFVAGMEWMASLRGWIVPEINYSSLNSIFSLLVLMGTVLVSALYPALRASRSANPGLMRKWKMPDPDGDDMRIEFPFTVSAMDFESVLGFLAEHFETYEDSSLGAFATWENRWAKGADDEPALESCMALTPYDLGVTQAFRMDSRPGKIEGITEIHIHLRRLSGQPGNWCRLNKRLLQDLRQQMLLWRALTGEKMEHYRLLALEGMEKAGSGKPLDLD
ncbi:MAG: FtsX-like permease family protein [Puniceicoccaceae bacterium]